MVCKMILFVLKRTTTFQGEVGKGSFQELDQVAAVERFTKYAGQARRVQDIDSVVEAAVKVLCHHARPANS